MIPLYRYSPYIKVFFLILSCMCIGFAISTPGLDAKVAVTNQGSSIQNSIYINKTVFDTMTNEIVVIWRLKYVPSLPTGAVLESSVSYSLDPQSFKDTIPLTWKNVDTLKPVDTTRITLGESIKFENKYHLGMWLRATTLPAVGPGDTVRDSVTLPRFSWQIFKFSDTLLETRTYANGAINLQSTKKFSLSDTIRNVTPPVVIAGFKSVGGGSCRFGKNQHEVPIRLGIRYDTVLANKIEQKIGMYRYVYNPVTQQGSYYVEHRAVRDTNANKIWINLSKDSLSIPNLTIPFVLLADTVAPVIDTSLTDFSKVVTADSVILKLKVRDNSTNTRCVYYFASGDRQYQDSLVTIVDKNTDTLIFVVKNSAQSTFLNPYYGFRGQFIADDGVSRKSFNVSRQVMNKLSCGIVNAIAYEWVPLSIPAQVDSASLNYIFRKSFDVPTWQYNIYTTRLYCWDAKTEAEPNNWIEYSNEDPIIQRFFDFYPGKIVWCKTNESKMIKFGPGYTTSLRDTFVVHLKPNNWTDFASPYLFAVLWKDVLLSSTKAVYDSIDIYRWQKDGAIFTPVKVFLGALDTLTKVKDSLKSDQYNGTFTVFNRSQRIKDLKLVPHLAPSSRANDAAAWSSTRYAAADAVQSRMNIWYVQLRWRLNSQSKKGVLQSVACGYIPHIGSTLFGPQLPSLSCSSVGIIDTSVQSSPLHAWAGQNVPNESGMSFLISFENSCSDPVTYEYFFDELNQLPAGQHAALFNTLTRQYEAIDGACSHVTVTAHSTLQMPLVIGTQEYLNKYSVFVPPETVGALKLVSNCYSRIVRIQAILPRDVKSMIISLYDLAGRCVWNSTQSQDLKPGLYSSQMNMGIGKSNMCAAGLYVMRVQFNNRADKVIFSHQQRIMFVR